MERSAEREMYVDRSESAWYVESKISARYEMKEHNTYFHKLPVSTKPEAS